MGPWTETPMTQAYAFKAATLSLKGQAVARRIEWSQARFDFANI
jgi:hypothetical protein